jgi:hypothetical protein
MLAESYQIENIHPYTHEHVHVHIHVIELKQLIAMDAVIKLKICKQPGSKRKAHVGT